MEGAYESNVERCAARRERAYGCCRRKSLFSAGFDQDRTLPEERNAYNVSLEGRGKLLRRRGTGTGEQGRGMVLPRAKGCREGNQGVCGVLAGVQVTS